MIFPFFSLSFFTFSYAKKIFNFQFPIFDFRCVGRFIFVSVVKTKFPIRMPIDLEFCNAFRVFETNQTVSFIVLRLTFSFEKKNSLRLVYFSMRIPYLLFNSLRVLKILFEEGKASTVPEN